MTVRDFVAALDDADHGLVTTIRSRAAIERLANAGLRLDTARDHFERWPDDVSAERARRAEDDFDDADAVAGEWLAA